jgi:hypothetical protein
VKIGGNTMLEIKRLRAEFLAQHCVRSGFTGIACLTCGTTGIALIHACQKHDLECRVFSNPKRWWSNEEFIKHNGTQFFDATSGHIQLLLMCKLGLIYRGLLGDIEDSSITVPSGSGETALSLKFAYPDKIIIAEYGNTKETKKEPYAPLNEIVRALCVVRVSDI